MTTSTSSAANQLDAHVIDRECDRLGNLLADFMDIYRETLIADLPDSVPMMAMLAFAIDTADSWPDLAIIRREMREWMRSIHQRTHFN
jgi:hypothetical protein